MHKVREAVYTISKGDRVLITLFTPIVIPIIAWLAWDVSQIDAQSIGNKLALWILADFFLVCASFLVLLWIWAAFRPPIIGKWLTSTTRKLRKYLLASYCGISLVCLLFFIVPRYM